MRDCLCGCGQRVNKFYVSGHNLINLKRTRLHRRRIGLAQKKVWKTKRNRLPIGSTNLDHHGYIRVKVIVGSGRWHKQHVLVAEKEIGRNLRKNEVVHHINGKKDDNRVTNLFVCDRCEHSKIEGQAASLLKSMVEAGLIIFNRETARYEVLL